MKQIIITLSAISLFSCYPVSHILVGESRSPITPSEVKILLEFPEEFEVIARIDASSEFAFKDPSFDFTWQSKMDKTMERLKLEASKLGANGLVIENTDNKTKKNITMTEDGTNVNESHYKTGTATAIFYK
tara:strand:- start:58427 stop:58819 length:393 start_codon:yes stop_codon:yes gene_type:complete